MHASRAHARPLARPHARPHARRLLLIAAVVIVALTTTSGRADPVDACDEPVSTLANSTAGDGDPTITAGDAGPTGEVDGAHRPARPNILMVMADDMRVDDLRFMPAVNHYLKDRGLEFTNSFSPYPLCCPARASFLTGIYAHNHQVFSHLDPYGFAAFDDHATLATALQAGGYNTGFVGKYLNGYGMHPSLVTGEPSSHYVPAGWTDWHGGLELARGSNHTGGIYNYFDPTFNVNGEIEEHHEYQTDVLGEKVCGLVTDYSGSPDPFFIYLSSVAPHHGAPVERDDPRHVSDPRGRDTTFATPARPDWVKGMFDDVVTRSPGLPADGGPSEADMSDKPRHLRQLPELNDAERAALVNVTRQRAESLYVLDRAFAGIVRRLQDTGEYDDTIIMFTSDNGYFLGEHRQRQGKIKPHEPSLRTPFLVAGPGIPHGRRYDPISTVDITATIADYAGVSDRMPYPLDGISRRRTITEGDKGWTVPVVTEALMPQLVSASQAKAIGFGDARDSIGLRTARYKYVRYVTGEVELYDLLEDPNELHSFHRDPAYRSVRRELAGLWRSYKDCRGEQCRRTLPSDLRVGPQQLARISERQYAGQAARYGSWIGPMS